VNIPRRLLFWMHFVAALCSLLAPQLAFAYEHPLTDESVRDAYFLGQDLDRSNAFLAQYVQSLPVPQRGPHVAEVELRTPYWQVVEASRENTADYSAQQAAADYRKRGDLLQVRLKVLFTPTYTGRPDDFWRAISVGLVQKNHMAATSVSAQLLYASAPDGYTWVIGANVFINFSVADVDSDSVDVEIIPPEGPTVHATFDLNRLS
jgi:hypothetical protein